MNKEVLKKIILFFGVVIFGVILLQPAIDNLKTKQEYENQKHKQNEILYKKYFGDENGK